MPKNEFVCPYCMYQAPLTYFENVGDGEIKCRRCRSRFTDPNGFSPDTAYADCDSMRPVTRFPFSLRGKNTVIRVRDGYLALLVGADGQRLWLEARDGPITNLPIGCQLYYICLSPRILWGTSGVKEFGAYGSAQLTLTRKFVEDFCRENRHIQAMEEYLQKAVSRWVTGYIRLSVSRQNISMLEQRDSYMSILGLIEEGIHMIRIDPMGFRNGTSKTGTFLSLLDAEETSEQNEFAPEYRPPVDLLKTPKTSYTIKSGIEEVFVKNPLKLERHKAGERIVDETLRGVNRVIRYRTKEFELPFGWGIYNQTSQVPGYYSAQGTISFFVDSTEKMGSLLNKTKSWQEFEEQFFMDIFRKELSVALRDIINQRAGRPDFQPDNINDYLSAMSVDLTTMLNGECSTDKAPAFRQFGLRVKQTDILGIHFYSTRR